MTLNAFMAALKTKGVRVTLTDTEGNELIKFYSDGYTGVESDLLARTIKKFDIPSAGNITVVLNDAPVTPEPEEEGTSTVDG